jgi:thiopeptide-type bacteriocin biosynthesis protein
MQPWPDDTRWIGAHIFFNGGIYTPECDRVVREVAEPFVRRCQAEGWIDGHFFIRYSEYGPHVRLRLHGKADVLEQTVWPALREHVRALYPDVSFDRPEGDQWRPDPMTSPDDEPLVVTHLADIEYEPETDRYGGPLGVRMAERFFEHSSEAAYALLQKTSAERSSRLGKGLLSMVVLMHVFCTGRAHARAFANNYGEAYLRGVARSEEGRNAWLGAFGSGYDQQAANLGAYVDEVWERMDEGDELSEALDAYAEGLREVRGRFRELFDAGELTRGADTPSLETWETAVGAIVSSYVHMMNNRLGISIQEESYLAYLCMRALDPKPSDSDPDSGSDETAVHAGDSEQG